MNDRPPGAHLKGQLLLSRLDYLREKHGEDVLDEVIALLSAEDQDRLGNPRREAWYPFRTLVALDRAIGLVLAPDDPGVYERLGEASARHRTEWIGEHASLVNIHAFLSRVADEHSLFHTFGRAAYKRTGFNSAELAFSGYPEKDEVYCLSARGYLRGSVGLLAGAAPTVDEIRCQCRGDEACVFALRWTTPAL